MGGRRTEGRMRRKREEGEKEEWRVGGTHTTHAHTCTCTSSHTDTHTHTACVAMDTNHAISLLSALK